MAMTINTNVVSLNAQRNLSLSGNGLSTTMQRLSSGLRVNSAKDDAAGLAIAERMNANTKGLAVASRNTNDGISLAQTAEGALGKVGDMLQRMRELAVQSSNATNSADDRKALQAEVSQLTAEIDRVAKTTSFNGKNLLDGSFSGAVFQVGANAGDNITVGGITNAKADALGKVTVGTKELTIAKDSVTDFAKEVGGMTIKVDGGEVIGLGTIAAASSEQERLGQVTAAINSKTADTGVTAFLVQEDDGSHTLTLKSSGDKTVTLGGGSPALTGTATGTHERVLADVTKDIAEVAFFFGSDTDAGNAIQRAEQALVNIGLTAAATNYAAQKAKFNDANDADYKNVSALQTELAKDFIAVTASAATILATDIKETDGLDKVSVSTQAGAWNAIEQIDEAIDQVNSARGDLGALQTRFEKTVENIGIQSENITAARGRIVDTDFAAETANLSRSQILQQAGTAMVAQANQLPQNVLSLLR